MDHAVAEAPKVLGKKEEKIEDLLKFVKKNAIDMLEAVRKTDAEEVKKLLQQLRQLERNVYKRERRDKNISPSERKIIKKMLAELQAVLKSENKVFDNHNYSRLKVLAGEEEMLAEEMTREIEKSILADKEKDTKKKIHTKFGEIIESLQTGDIVGVSHAGDKGLFQRAASIFEIASGQRVSHVGIVDVRNHWYGKRIFVIEAGDTVVETPFEFFLEKCKGRIAIYRYKDGLTDEQKMRMSVAANKWVKSWYEFFVKATKYDFALAPGDEELYCSEVVDEAYNAAGIQLTNDYVSVDEFHKRVAELIKQGVYKMSGLELESAKQAMGIIAGPKGFYKGLDIDKVDKFRKSIITPAAIIKNSSTVKIFDNLT